MLIMARAPRPGAAKTRLEPLLGPTACARLQSALIRHTAGWAASAVARTCVAFTPADAQAELAPLVPPDTSLVAQRDGDLGARLTHACAHVFDGRGPLVVVGTDAPLLGPDHVRVAERELRRGRDACLIPALDGGYTLIALARPAPEVFALPPEAWGGPRVLEWTLRALRRAGLTHALLDPVGDVDTPRDALALRDDPRCPTAVRAALRAQGPAA